MKDAVVRRCSSKYVFLKIPQNSQENNCVGVFFNKVAKGFVKHCPNTVQKMKMSIKDFFSKCDQIRSFLQIWSHLLKKSLMENLIFCAV